jgi:hypothetical protein
MGAMLTLQPVLGRLLVQEAGHVVDLSPGAAAFDLPFARNLLSFENYICVCHSANMGMRRPLTKAEALPQPAMLKLI